MILTYAKCGNCRSRLPLGAGLLRVRLAPRQVACPRCGAANRTSLTYRAGWTGGLLWKLMFLAAIPFFVAVCLIDGRNVVESFWLGMGTGVLVGGLFGSIASMFLCLPVQIVIDLVAWIVHCVLGCRADRSIGDRPAPIPSSGMVDRHAT